ncbi:MAG: hypothetical protein R3E76_09775 [Planctomycetota bacterium]
MIRFVTRSAGVSPAPGAGNLPAAPGAGRPRPVQAGSLRYVLPLLLLLGACSQPQANNATDNQVDEHRDQWRPREAQSDFLDIGEQAGVEWLSFVPDDQHEYPEYFDGLDRDQKNRLRLAPKGSDEQVLIEFDLPGNFRLWPVDWYGTELMAVSRSSDDRWQHSIAIAEDKGRSLEDVVESLAQQRGGRAFRSRPSDTFDVPHAYWCATTDDELFIYASRQLIGPITNLLLIVEVRVDASVDTYDFGGVERILERTSIKREIGLEGSPKHKCTSALDEQLAGTLRFPDGTLRIPISEGQLVRKIGGDSTIQIDGEGGEPWILIRRLKESETEGDLRARLRRDTTFNRRLKVPSGKFSEGYVPEGAALPVVCFDYDDSAAENNLLGILKAGNELLTFEVVTRGVVDGDKRRAAKAAALKLLANATAEPATEAPEFEPLVGWNAGTMGTGE